MQAGVTRGSWLVLSYEFYFQRSTKSLEMNRLDRRIQLLLLLLSLVERIPSRLVEDLLS